MIRQTQFDAVRMVVCPRWPTVTHSNMSLERHGGGGDIDGILVLTAACLRPI